MCDNDIQGYYCDGRFCSLAASCYGDGVNSFCNSGRCASVEQGVTIKMLALIVMFFCAAIPCFGYLGYLICDYYECGYWNKKKRPS